MRCPSPRSFGRQVPPRPAASPARPPVFTTPPPPTHYNRRASPRHTCLTPAHPRLSPHLPPSTTGAEKYASLESQVDEVVQRLRARVEELEEEVVELRGDGSSQAEEVRRLRMSLTEAGDSAQLAKEQMAMKVRWDAPRAEHLTPRAAPQPLTTPHLHPLQMFEQKSDKKLMTTVVLGWRRAAERGRMERRQGDEMAAAAAAAAAVEEQQMAVKERMAKAKYAAHSGAILRNSARNFLTRLLPLQVRVEHARRAHHRLYRVEGRVGGGGALTEAGGACGRAAAVAG